MKANDLLEKYDIEAIHCLDDAITYRARISFKSKVGMIWHAIEEITCKRWNIEVQSPAAEIGFLYTPLSEKRKDYQSALENVESTTQSHGRMICSKQKCTDLLWGFKHRDLLSTLWSYCKEKKEAFYARLLLLRTLISTQKLYDALEIKQLPSFKCVVSMFDAYAADSFLIQYFKFHNINTATLQHGSFIAPRECADKTQPHYQFLGQALTFSRADYFLAWNNFTKREALTAGMSPAKIKVLGIPKYIGVKSCDVKNTYEKHVFGVLMDWDADFDNNVNLLTCANSIAEKLQIPYCIKAHPTSNIERYQKYISENAHFLEKGLSISDYAQLVDFTILTNSSCMVELTFLGASVFHFHIPGVDLYENIHVNRFENVDDFMICYTSKSQSNQLWMDICTVSDVWTSYHDFFQRAAVRENNDKKYYNKV